MKKIVFSANTSWYLYNFRKSSLIAFINKGYEVHCVCPEDSYSEKLTNEIGCKWHNIKMDRKGSNPLKDLLLFCSFLYLYLKINPIYVFNFTLKNNIYSTWAAKLVYAKVINNVSGLGTAFINNNFTSKVVRLLYKLSQPFSSHVFCQNKDDFELLVSNGLINKNKLRLIPGSGVDVKRFIPQDENEKKLYTTFSFLFVGRLMADKGLNELFAAAMKLNQQGYKFVVILCGFSSVDNKSAISLEKLKFWTSHHYIEWIGSSDHIESVYEKADCVVLPSYREGMPKTLIEAGAMGIPSIATDVAGCKHIIEDNYNGLLCEVKNIDSLAIKMKKMINMTKEDRLRLSKNARKKVVEQFDESIVVNETLKIVDA